MLELNYTYEACVANSERVAWKLDEIMPVTQRLNFDLLFLPNGLALTDKISGLSTQEKLFLNQITGHSYLCLFHFVEEYILATMVERAAVKAGKDEHATRALLRFADEEVKHQQLFARYRDAFARDFRGRAEVVDGAQDVAAFIRSKSLLAVMILTLHLELTTQQHFKECVRDQSDVDPLFAKLLRCHWLEESQHAKIDALELQDVARGAKREEIDVAFQEYHEILSAFDELLERQAELDLESLERVTRKKFPGATATRIIQSQHRAYRRIFMFYGMTNGTFEKICDQLSPEARREISDRSADFS